MRRYTEYSKELARDYIKSRETWYAYVKQDSFDNSEADRLEKANTTACQKLACVAADYILCEEETV